MILKVDFYCRVIYVFNFMPLKKVEALYESRKWTWKLSEVQPLSLRVMFHTYFYFIYARRIYVRTHVKITRQWKSTLSLNST